MRWRRTVRRAICGSHSRGRCRCVVWIIHSGRPLPGGWGRLLRWPRKRRGVLSRRRRRAPANRCRHWAIRFAVLPHLLPRTGLAWEWRCWPAKGLSLVVGIRWLRWVDIGCSLTPTVGRSGSGRWSMRTSGAGLCQRRRRAGPRGSLWSLSSVRLGMNVSRHSLREISRGLASPE